MPGRSTTTRLTVPKRIACGTAAIARSRPKNSRKGYFDIETLDSRLWLRVGKQFIVWGKTELFRTTDQFNPLDYSIATLGSLEETRIGLWAFRGVYSLYEVGPLQDVRIEAAFNFDEFKPNDLGNCGEPYTVNLVCKPHLWRHGARRSRNRRCGA